MRTVEQRLFRRHTTRGLVRYLAANTRNVVGVRQVPVAIDDERRERRLVADCVAGVHAKHQIRREVGGPGPRVRNVVPGVQRVVPDKAAEDPALDRQAGADWRYARNIRRTKVPKPVGATDVGGRRRKSEGPGIFAGLDWQL